jgi:hypothetical protein
MAGDDRRQTRAVEARRVLAAMGYLQREGEDVA